MKPDEIKRYIVTMDFQGGSPVIREVDTYVEHYPRDNVTYKAWQLVLAADHDRVVAELRADLALLSDKAGAAVVAYRAALSSLTDSFKYPIEVRLIAWAALGCKTVPGVDSSQDDASDEHGSGA